MIDTESETSNEDMPKLTREERKEIRREKNKIYCKQYYYQNRDNMLEKVGVKYNCPYCNREIRRDTKHKHEKSKVCLKARNLI